MSSIYAEEYRRLLGLLLDARKRSGITQQSLADSLGRPQSFVSNAAGISSLNAKFLGIRSWIAPDAPWGTCCRRCDRRKSLAHAAKASRSPATPMIATT